MFVEVDDGAVYATVGLFDPDGMTEEVGEIAGGIDPDWEPDRDDMRAIGEELGRLLDGSGAEDAISETACNEVKPLIEQAVRNVCERRQAEGR